MSEEKKKGKIQVVEPKNAGKDPLLVLRRDAQKPEGKKKQ